MSNNPAGISPFFQKFHPGSVSSPVPHVGGSNEHPTKPPTPVQTFYFIPHPSSGLGLPLGGEAGRAPRPGEHHRLHRASHAAQKRRRKRPQNGHETPPTPPPNPVPQTQICGTGGSDTEQHKNRWGRG